MLIPISFIKIGSKVDPSVWRRFGGVIQIRMTCTVTGERFPIGLQGFTKLRTASDSAINEHLHSFELTYTNQAQGSVRFIDVSFFCARDLLSPFVIR